MLLALARWWLTILGGALIGGGLLLHAQVETLHALRSEVHGTFFLWRAVGQLTFVWQDDLTQAALWAGEVPAEVLRESSRGAWALVAVGTVLAVGSRFLRRHGRRRG